MNLKYKGYNCEEVKDTTSSGQEDMFLDFPFGNKTIKHFRQVVPVQIHHFYITDEIRKVDPYINLINTLRTAEQHDTVFIYLNTPGGNLLTTLEIISAMNQSAATIITCMEGHVASAGTMIFLKGHRYVIGENSFFMAHNYSATSQGKGFELKSRQQFDEKYFHKLMKNIYDGFLDENEINSLMEDRDVWLDADEVAKRLGDKVILANGKNMDAQNMLASLLDQQSLVSPDEILKEEVPVVKETKPTKHPKKRKKTVPVA